MKLLKDEIILKILDISITSGYTFERILKDVGMGIDQSGIYFKVDNGLIPEHCRKEDTPKDARIYSKTYIQLNETDFKL